MIATNSLIANLDLDEYDLDFHDWLKDITRYLDQPALGITLQVINRGLSSLSVKQRYIFERYVVDELAYDGCSLCSNRIPWCEMSQARHSGCCAYCNNMLSKD